jgi:hypothetical protein
MRLTAAICACWGWCLATAPALAQPTASADDAAEHFHNGEAAYAARDYEGAIGEFRKSLDATGSPNAQLAIARCYRELGRLAESVSAYERTVAEAGIRAESDPFYAQTQGVAKAELAAIAGKVGRLRVEASPAHAVVTINGLVSEGGNRDRSLPVPPGITVIEVSAPAHQPERREVVVSAGQQLVERVTLVAEQGPSPQGADSASSGAAEPGSSLLAPLGWTGLIVGAVGVGAFAVFYPLASSQHDELKSKCVTEPCSRSTYDDVSGTGKTYQAIAHVGLGVGLVALAVGASLLIWDAASAPSADVQLSKDGAFFSLGGAL